MSGPNKASETSLALQGQQSSQLKNSSPMAASEMAEPHLGDVGLLESQTQRVLCDNENLTEESIANLRKEQSKLSLRDAQIQEYIRTTSIQLTEE